MAKSYYDWDNKGWENGDQINIKKKKKKKKQKEAIGIGGFLLVLLILVIASTMFLKFTEKGKNLVAKFTKEKTTDLYEDWDYGNSNEEEAISHFDMDAAQSELASQDGYVVPTATLGNKDIKLPDAEGVYNDGSVIIIREKADSKTSTTTNTNTQTTTRENTQQVPQHVTQQTTQQTTPIITKALVVTPIVQQPTQAPIVQQETPVNNEPQNTQVPIERPTQTTSPTYEYDESIKSQTANQVSSYSTMANDMLTQINQVRVDAGSVEVSLDETLSEMCAYRSLDMVNRDYYSHYYNEISQLKVVINVWSRNGRHYENLAKIKSDKPVEASISGWKNSSGHYSAMINNEMTKVGIGIAEKDGYYYITTIYSN